MSRALQTLGFETLELCVMFMAFSMSAYSSMYMCETPTPPVIAGILACSPTILTKDSPPLGIIRSIYLFNDKNSEVILRSVDFIRFIIFSSYPDSVIDCLIICSNTILVLIDSFPPFKITAFPDLIPKHPISVVISGLLSYITPSTPKGTVIFLRFISSFKVFSSII